MSMSPFCSESHLLSYFLFFHVSLPTYPLMASPLSFLLPMDAVVLDSFSAATVAQAVSQRSIRLA